MHSLSLLLGLAQAALVCCATVPHVGRALTKCVASTFSSALPSGASIEKIAKVQAGGSYTEGLADLGYPSPPYTPTGLPELCALIISVVSSSSSRYRFGIYLPTSWNNKFLAVGNGGFAGGINWYDMAPGTQYGFATISTDTGHNSSVAVLDWAYNSPEKRTDWGWRSLHGSTQIGKSLTKAYYGKSATYSYYSGCSTGGRQGLKEVQISPDSFDGALIGAPGWYTSHVNNYVTKLATLNLPATDPKHIPQDLMLGAYAAFVRSQCDAADGVSDGIVSAPENCTLDYSKIRCGNAGVNASACLTDAQIQTTKNIYADYVDSSTGALLYPGLTKSSETQWDTYLGSSAPSPFGIGYDQYFLYNDPTFTWQNYNDSAVYLAEKLDPGNATADLYDLSAYKARGGKIIMYHGLADSIVPTKGSNLYYQRVTAAMGDPSDFFRLFFIPGMQHCWGTSEDAPWAIGGAFQAGITGTNQWSVPGFKDANHDALMALQNWVEKGTVVNQIIATTWKTPTDITSGVLRQRPLCPYPKKAVLKAGANEKVASNWSCQ